MEHHHGSRPRGQRQSQESEGKAMPKSRLIMAYTVTVCLSCLYLETQHFQVLLGDGRARYMAYLTYFDVLMCLASYWQTIRIGAGAVRLSKLQPLPWQSQKFQDNSYSPTHLECTSCNNYKFPRVHHCSSCGHCVRRMDHHCIWTQTCIGYDNQKCFYLFCFYMAIGVFQFWYFTYRVLTEHKVPLFYLMEPGVIILWVFTGFSALFVGIMIVMLLITHSVMLLTNYRTLDGMKTKKVCPLPFFQRNIDPRYLNLFDRGELQNIKQFFGRQWWLWWVPTARQPENDIYPQPLAPHPAPTALMRETNLYDLQIQYRREMKRMPTIDFLPFFAGKKIKINNSVVRIAVVSSSQLQEEHTEQIV